MARGMAGSISNMLEGIYGVAERAEEVSADPRLLGAAMAIGIATSMIAAWLPARSAARVDPVQALQKGKYQVLTAGENRARRLAAAVLMAVALVMLWIGHIDLVLCRLRAHHSRGAAARADAGAVVLTRDAAGAEVASAGRRGARRRQPDSGAAPHVGRRRGADAVARPGHRSRRHRPRSYNSIVDWMDTALNPDLFVSGSQNLSDRTFRFPEALAGSIVGDSRCRGRAAGAKPAREHRRRPGDAGRHRHRQLRASRPPPDGGRRSARHVSAGARRAGRDRVRQLRAAAATNSSAIASTFRRPAG